MPSLIDLDHNAARAQLLRGSSYFRDDLPSYLSFEPILKATEVVLSGDTFLNFRASDPGNAFGVNYEFMANKDGRFAWRPYELIHPAIYVSLVNTICDEKNWTALRKRFESFTDSTVECCSVPLFSDTDLSDTATQVRSWWERNEQRSLSYSLDFSHLLHTDVTDCYGSLYTHSIAWAIHGKDTAKSRRRDYSLVGNQIDSFVQAGRHGQTNGVSQGSMLMDLLAELVLGYVDEEITKGIADRLGSQDDFKILRYRDDYRIFANSDERCETVLKIISAKLLLVGMKLGVSKTVIHRNVVQGSIKADKLAGVALQGIDLENARTMQKELLRLHSFGQQFPNSGALKRLVVDFLDKISTLDQTPDNVEVCVAIATDIGYQSPTTFPAVAGILSHLMRKAKPITKQELWERVRRKMQRVPHNGYLDLWLQRVTQPRSIGLDFESEEPLCKVTQGTPIGLWESNWISSKALKSALDTTTILISDPEDSSELIEPIEVALFYRNSFAY